MTAARESIQRLVDKKQAEIGDLEVQIREARAYLQALQDSLRVLPRDASDAQPDLRPNSALSRTRELIKNSGKPLHITEILKLLGKPTDKKTKVSLAGTLSSYARAHKIFKKTSPNTFGLMEMSYNSQNGNANSEAELERLATLPASFGKM